MRTGSFPVEVLADRPFQFPPESVLPRWDPTPEDRSGFPVLGMVSSLSNQHMDQVQINIVFDLSVSVHL